MLSTNVFAQTEINEINFKKQDPPYIEVTGTAKMEIVPDEIYIKIVLKERQEGKEKITIEKQEIELKAALKSLGISLENFYLSDAVSNYIKVRWSKKDVIISKEYILKVENAEMVGKVFEKLDELNILEANIERVDHSKIIEYNKEVKIKAIKAAKNKADYLLKAIGEKKGKALIVKEIIENEPSVAFASPQGANGRGTYYSIRGNASINKPAQFKKIKITSAIYVKFQIL